MSDCVDPYADLEYRLSDDQIEQYRQTKTRSRRESRKEKR